MTDDVNRQIGQLEGRMGAMEDRQARHETTIATMFGRIEGKLDDLKTRQADADGARRERRTITAVLIAAGTAAAAWIGHVTIGSK